MSVPVINEPTFILIYRELEEYVYILILFSEIWFLM